MKYSTLAAFAVMSCGIAHAAIPSKFTLSCSVFYSIQDGSHPEKRGTGHLPLEVLIGKTPEGGPALVIMATGDMVGPPPVDMIMQSPSKMPGTLQNFSTKNKWHLERNLVMPDGAREMEKIKIDRDDGELEYNFVATSASGKETLRHMSGTCQRVIALTPDE